MIKHRESKFWGEKSQEIDTKSLEIGDKFVIVKRDPAYGLSVTHLTVSKITARDMVSVSPSGKTYRWNKGREEWDCYSSDSEVVKKARLEIKKNILLRELNQKGVEAIDQELFSALEAWSKRQIEKKVNGLEH